MNSRSKGKRGELEAARELTAITGRVVTRAARNGVDGGEDLLGLPGVHVEVKRRKALAVAEFMEQAMTDRQPAELPLVMLREDGGPWMFLMMAHHAPRLLERLSPSRTV